jgi:tetratricopeptide (TPR) repeat protein
LSPIPAADILPDPKSSPASPDLLSFAGELVDDKGRRDIPWQEAATIRTERELRTFSRVPKQRIRRPKGRGLLILLVVAAGGCGTFGRRTADEVVSARQLSLRGMEAVERGRWQEAETYFNRALETHPSDERAHRQLAEIEWQRGAQDEAVGHMQEAARLSGGDAAVLIRLGQMQLARGDLVQALHSAEEAIRIDRAEAGAWALKGHVLRQQGQRTEALAAYHRALSHQQHYAEVQLAAADIYRELGLPQRMLGTLDALADRYPPGQQPQQVLLMQGLALKSLGRHQDAVESLALAARCGPASADLLYELADAQLQAGDPTNARLALSQALAQSPQHAASLRLQSHLDAQQQSLSASAQRAFTPPN